MFKVVLDKKGFLKQQHPLNSNSNIYIEPQQLNTKKQATRIVDPFKKVFYQSLFKYYNELDQQQQQQQQQKPNINISPLFDDNGVIPIHIKEDDRKKKPSIGRLLKLEQNAFMSPVDSEHDPNGMILLNPPKKDIYGMDPVQAKEAQEIAMEMIQQSHLRSLKDMEKTDKQLQVIPRSHGKLVVMRKYEKPDVETDAEIYINKLFKKPSKFLKNIKNFKRSDLKLLGKVARNLEKQTNKGQQKMITSDVEDTDEDDEGEDDDEEDEELTPQEREQLLDWFYKIPGFTNILMFLPWLYNYVKDLILPDKYSYDVDDIDTIDTNTTDLVLPNKAISEKPLELPREVTSDSKTIPPRVESIPVNVVSSYILEQPETKKTNPYKDAEETKEQREEVIYSPYKQNRKRSIPVVSVVKRPPELSYDNSNPYISKKYMALDPEANETDKEFYRNWITEYEAFEARKANKEKLFKTKSRELQELTADLKDLNENDSVRAALFMGIPSKYNPEPNKLIKTLLSMNKKELDGVAFNLSEKAKRPSVGIYYKEARAIVNKIKNLQRPLKQMYDASEQLDDVISDDLTKRFGKQIAYNTIFQNAFK